MPVYGIQCLVFIIFHKFPLFIHKVTFSSITQILIHKSFGGISGGSQRMAYNSHSHVTGIKF